MKCIITNLDSVCNGCGFFDNETPVNNGYGCKHPYNEDPEIIVRINSEDNYPNFSTYGNDEDIIIAKSFTKRNIKCSKRLAKKFLKKANSLSFEEREKILNSKGYYHRGRCFDYSCPIAWSIDFESLKEPNNYINSDEYNYIESDEEMPWGFGDDLMGMAKKEADAFGISY